MAYLNLNTRKISNEPRYEDDIEFCVNYALRQAKRRRALGRTFVNSNNRYKRIIDEFNEIGIFDRLKNTNISVFYERCRLRENRLYVRETAHHGDANLVKYSPISYVREGSWARHSLDLTFGKIVLMPTHLGSEKHGYNKRLISGGSDSRRFGESVNEEACNKKQVKSRVDVRCLTFKSPYQIEVYDQTIVLSFTTNHPFITTRLIIVDLYTFIHLLI
ncbi:Hypothetical protein HVR_LOCUS905 [uncultured virus]|nr:Hypothetical protein HVR_LOCUS905 [uncultured virus]